MRKKLPEPGSDNLYILGINCFKHDAAAALMKNGTIVAASEEERFIRQKHTGRFPEHAIRTCLEQEGIGPDEISHVAYYMVPSLALKSLLTRYALKTLLPTPRTRMYRTFVRHQLPAVLNFFRIPSLFLSMFPGYDLGHVRFHFIPHHSAHAASAFYASPFEESMILTLDGVGEEATGGVFIADNKGIKKLRQWVVPHSLGLFYRSVTGYLGFNTVFDEFKVMGLSAYGKPTMLKEMLTTIRANNTNSFHVDTSYFDFLAEFSGTMVTDRFRNVFGPERMKNGPLESRHENIAASLQAALEETVMTIIQAPDMRALSGNLCFAGGVAMNSCLNGCIDRHGGYDGFFVQPVSYDAGTAMGAAAYVDRIVLANRRTTPIMEHLFLGPMWQPRAIQKFIEGCKLPFETPQNIASDVADMLAEGKIVGWFQGNMEFGARALGHRSILADPRKAENKDLLNNQVKHREPFRPFAPAVKEEDASRFFETSSPSPYMARVLPVKHDARDIIPAVTHVDGTARVQTVNRKNDPLFWSLLDEFERITGIPVILNTSFNVQGEPIVCTPREALACFMTTGIDALAVGPFLIIKPKG